VASLNYREQHGTFITIINCDACGDFIAIAGAVTIAVGNEEAEE